MAKIRTTKPHEFGKHRTTGLGRITFDNDGVSVEELDADAAAELCSISPTLELVGGEAEESAEATETKEEGGKDATDTDTGGDAGKGADETPDATDKGGEEKKSRGRGSRAKKEKTDDTPNDELSEDNQAILDNLKQSSPESIYQMLEQLEVPADEYSSIDVTADGGKEALIEFAFGKLRKED